MMRLAIDGIGKRYAAPVLRGVSLALAPGRILGLVGENGAGKSTLANIITGVVPADAGTMAVDGVPYLPASPRAAIGAGVALASQEFSLFDTLDVADNLCIGAPPRAGLLIDRAGSRAAARALLDEVGLPHIAVDAPLAGQSVATRQLIEFAKALATGARLICLDEPTAALAGPEADRLHAVMAARARGGTVFLYISHRLQDVIDRCDDVAVLRDGVVVLAAPTTGLTTGALIAAMSGRAAVAQSGRAVTAVPGPPALVATGITTAALPHPVDLTLRRGEIVGLAGLAGAGRTEFIEALFGLAPLTGGSVVRQDGAAATAVRSPRGAVAAGIGLVTEDRRASGIFAGQSPAFTASIAAIASLATRGIVRAGEERRRVAAQIDALGIRWAGNGNGAGDNGGGDVARLSGGNQQKLLIARWLIRGVDVLLLDEPTRGVDAGATRDIHDEIRRLAASGCAVLMVSSELEELAALADRIVVLSSRRIVAQFAAPPFDTAAILTAAFDAHVGTRAGAPPAIQEKTA